MAWRLLAWAAGTACRFGDAAEASRHAVEHARLAGDVRQERRAATAMPPPVSLGPTLVDEAIDRCEAAIEQTAATGSRRASSLAVLAASMRCRASSTTRARSRARSRALFEELGLEMEKARLGMEAASIERLAGDLEGAERGAPGRVRGARRRGRDGTSSRRSPGSSRRRCSSRVRWKRRASLCDRSRELTTEADIATAGPVALRPRPDPHPARRVRRSRGDLTRGARVPGADGRDRLPDRVQRRARRGPRRGGPRARRRAKRSRARASCSPRRKAAS